MPAKTRLFLFVRAGGRCEFDGCNRYLLEHHLTKTDGIFAQMAHIWAFSDQGPRASRAATGDKHAHSNLMLLCPECHKLVDDDPQRYTALVLREHKRAHEDRVFLVTDTKPDRHTVVFVLRAKVGGQAVSVSRAEMESAVAPRYIGRDFVECDLTTLPDHAEKHYWCAARQAIEEKTRDLYERRFEGSPAQHVSVFALASIPLLVFLGTQLSNKVPTSLYQRHRDSEDWKWKEDGEPVQYKTETLRRGTHQGKVALLLSLSGRISESNLPLTIDQRYTVVEIGLDGMEATPRFLELEESLHAFRDEFLRVVRRIVAQHEELRQIDLFPAVPAPVAVAVGRDILPKRDPTLLVYDYDKRVGGFVPTLEVNEAAQK
ncbi:MAG TPA: SAVED domain-containing protein [Thermoanaerobaculia bacterium]